MGSIGRQCATAPSLGAETSGTFERRCMESGAVCGTVHGTLRQGGHACGRAKPNF